MVEATVTCACWRCEGRADDGTFHAEGGEVQAFFHEGPLPVVGEFREPEYSEDSVPLKPLEEPL